MLTTLSITHFATADKLELEFSAGMTVITGETGAGKSISLDALGLALGARADSQVVRHGCSKADIRAEFTVNENTAQWLKAHDFHTEQNECILRRVITSEGRSKAYINDMPVNLATLKSLGDLLVDIHSQHAHHQLMHKEHHQLLFDAYLQQPTLLQHVAHTFNQWHSTQQHIKQLKKQALDNEQRKEFLAFQLDEFTQLRISHDEYQTLEEQHTLASQADALASTLEAALHTCKEKEKGALLDQLNHLVQSFSSFEHQALSEIKELLNNAAIQLEEAVENIKQQQKHLSANEYNLAEIEQRLSLLHDLARKHRTHPAQLAQRQKALEDELVQINQSDENIHTLEQQAEEYYRNFTQSAETLSGVRNKARDTLVSAVHEQLAALGMAHCRFDVVFNQDKSKPSLHGFESIEFLISTNPSSPAQSLHKIASGGELSRISLAIQVVTAKSSTIPVLIFDEVDVGIGGATAEIVGQLLKTLSQSAQIICVTHQAQVAAFAQQHLLVSKQLKDQQMNTQVEYLRGEKKILEIARMMGGVEITSATQKHAAEMVKKSQGS